MENFLLKLDERGLILKLKGDDLLLKSKNGKLTKSQITAIKKDQFIPLYIKTHREELVEYLKRQQVAFKNATLNLEEIAAVYKLSPLQEGVLFHCLYEEHLTVYITQFQFDLSENLQVEAFQKAWQFVINNHTILRTAFIYEQVSIPIQCVYKKAVLPFEVLDYSGHSTKAAEQQFNELVDADRRRGFDFEKPPLIRITLIKMPNGGYKMIYTKHHILWDGWSDQIVISEVLEAYHHYLKGRNPEPVAEDRYEDYIKFINAIDPKEEKKFWSGYLDGFEEPTLFPFVKSGGDRNKGVGKSKKITLEFDELISQKIYDFVQIAQVTPNTLVQAVWSFLLSTYAGKEDVVFGVTVSGRPADEKFEKKVGLFINAIPLRVKIDPTQGVLAFLKTLQQEHIQSRTFQYTSIKRIQNWIGVRGDLFDSIMIVRNFPLPKSFGLENQDSVEIGNVKVEENNNYLLSIEVSTGHKIKVDFKFNSVLLEEYYADLFKGHFEHVLQQFIAGEDKLLKTIELPTLFEKQQLLEQFNDTQFDFPLDKSLVDLWEEQVLQTPNHTALVLSEGSITYKELNERANILASYLHNRSKESSLIGLCVNRSAEMMVGLLGIMKSGHAYVPIDPTYPQNRIDYIIKDSGIRLMVSLNHLNLIFKEVDDLDVLLLDEEWLTIEQEYVKLSKKVIQSTNLAYVIYTSGSTGRPKGVLIEHRSLVNFLFSMQHTFRLDENSIMLAVTTYSFDISYLELYLPLLAGGRVVLSKSSTASDADKLQELMINYKPTHMQATPATWQLLIESGWKNKTGMVIMTGGEAISTTLKDFLTNLGAQPVWNLYGPTETTIWSTQKQLQAGEPVTIGQPIANTQIYILDNLNNLCPVGVTGELCIGGAGLARGYLNRPDLNNEKFIVHRFNAQSEERLYRTGDLARWLPNGELECLGRKDRQVKIRGYRIELGEIEAALQQSEVVRQGVVVLKTNLQEEKQLLAYIVPERNFDRTAIIKDLKSVLPDYMIPTFLIEMEALPLTPNGKLDRKALPDPDTSILRNNNFIEAKTDIELQQVDIWKSILELEKIGIEDNFFELGGHSLLATRLVSAIRRELNVKLRIKDVFLNPTISKMTELIKIARDSGTEVTAIKPQIDRPELVPLSYAQERLWFIDRMSGSLEYHMPIVQAFSAALDVEILDASLKKILERHEVLRTLILEDKGRPFQKVIPVLDWKINRINLVEAYDANKWLSIIKEEINQPFNLAEDFKLRANLYKKKDQSFVLILVVHHIAFDGWSANLFMKEVMELYLSKKEKRQSNLNSIEIQYADYSIWQRAYLSDTVLDNKLAYWEHQLSNVAQIDLPTDFPYPSVLSTEGAATIIEINPALTAGLKKECLHLDVTPFMALLTVFKILLYRYTGQTDICVGSPVANRGQYEVENLLGFFVNSIALRSDLSGNPTFVELLSKVKQTTLEGYNHQDAPFEKVVEKVAGQRSISRSPIFQVLFSMNKFSTIHKMDFGDLIASNIDFDKGKSQYELALSVVDKGTYYNIEFTYCKDLFKSTTIERMAHHFNMLLSAIIANPRQAISNLNMLTTEETSQILLDFNQPLKPIPSDLPTVMDLFESQILKRPDNIALSFGDKSMSYQILNEKSNQLGHYLQKKGIRENDIIGICVNRSFEMIIGILGILKSGAAYLPIDPTLPAKRIQFMVENANASYVLSQAAFVEKFQPKEKEQVIIFEEHLSNIEGQPLTNITNELNQSSLAYVIYTSGSTGAPKGVMVTHENLSLRMQSEVEILEVDENYTSCLLTNFVFDVSLLEIFLPLLEGGTLVIPDEEIIYEPSKIIQLFEEQGVTNLQGTPAFVATILEGLTENYFPSQLRQICLGGDSLSSELVRKIRNLLPNVQINNHYGPTETCIDAVVLENIHDFDQNIIGQPIAFTQAYITDDYLNLLPIGVVGELLIGGPVVAKGYIEREDLTNEKFIQTPYSEGRLYKSGDLVKWKENGAIQFIGRKDYQVKIRGFRIELEEIEMVLKGQPLVKDAIVIAKENKIGIKHLVAFISKRSIILKEELQESNNNKLLTPAMLKKSIEGLLPDYMVPDRFMIMEDFPLTPNGKVDRNAIKQIDVTTKSDLPFIATRNKTEQILEEIWKEYLGIDQISINDDFFELGGHSLLLVQLTSAIREQLNLEIPIKVLFQYSTIAKLSDYLLVTGGTSEEKNEDEFEVLDF